ncbi:MAG: protein kinase [Candidatus Aminicenantes bacterium]|nr:protein kinase [Candidatus Aminicenantes bacterium]
MIGKTISHYKIIEEIGRGGMGVVYKAEDTLLKRLAALKFLPPEMTRDPAAKERFVLEAQAASALNHAHVTTIYGIEESPEGTFIAMEFVEGQTLKELIAVDRSPSTGHPLPISQVLDIAIQVAEGLAAAHEKGIVHRDIKADNIMLSARGQAKIMDFGLAKLKGAEKLTQTRSTLGTLAYMSPEQAKGEEVDLRSDLFSFGVVLYELLAGRLPFAGEYQAAVIYAIINEDPQPVARYNSHVSAELECIVGKALAKDREERYQHADELLADLRREKKKLEYVKAGLVIPEKAGPKSKHKMLPLALAAAAVAVLVLFILIFSPFKIRFDPQQTVQAGENSLAVMYFENMQDPADKNRIAQMITALLTTGLSDSPRYIQVVSSQRLFDILNLLGKGDLHVIDKTVASEIARKAGVQWMVTGKVLSTEPNIVLISEISNVATGKILATQRVNGAPGEDLFAVIDKLSPQVVKALALPEQAQNELGRPVAEATTHSEDAYRSYLEGLENFYKGYTFEAESDFAKTLDYDPAFAMAYYRLAVIKLIDEEYREAKTYIAQATKYSANMTQWEKLYLEGLADIAAGQYERGIKTIREITSRFPDEKEAFFWLAYIYRQNLYNPEEAISCLNKAIAIDSNYKFAYNHLAYSYNDSGDFEKSLWAINKYISLAPGEANPYDSRGDLYAYNGRLNEAIESYKKALAIKPDFLVSLYKIGILHLFKKKYAEAESVFKKLATSKYPTKSALAIIPIYQGKLKQGLTVLSTIMAAYRAEQYAGSETGYCHINKAEIHEERGELGLAIEETKTGMEIFKQADPDAPLWFRDYYAYLLSRNGKWAEAEAVVRELKTESEINWEIRFMYWRAEGALALARNDLKGAQTYFEKDKTNDFWGAYLLARTDLQLGALDKAVAIMEKALTRYNYERFYEPILAAKAYYLLGQAYERSGWKDKAIQKYEEFLDIWKDADTGLPEVTDARQRLAKLKKL